MLSGWLIALALTATGEAAPAAMVDEVLLIDPARSEVGFSVRMRWLQRFHGRFAHFRGEVRTLEGGARQVEVEIDAASLDMGTRERATEWALSDEFFDAINYPVIVFVSDPFSPALAQAGGPLTGELSLRGVTRRVDFVMLASDCGRPGHDCPVRVDGVVRRTDFGMDAHRVAVQDRVRLDFAVRFAEPTP